MTHGLRSLAARAGRRLAVLAAAALIAPGALAGTSFTMTAGAPVVSSLPGGGMIVTPAAPGTSPEATRVWISRLVDGTVKSDSVLELAGKGGKLTGRARVAVAVLDAAAAAARCVRNPICAAALAAGAVYFYQKYRTRRGTKISPGCKNCYAETMARRLKAMGAPGYENGFTLTLLPNRLGDPLKRNKPTIYFLNSMSDLFHEKVPDAYIEQVLDVVARTPQHTYQILTKRAQRMARFFARGRQVPPNAWMGVSVENRKHGVPRIDHLRQVNAEARNYLDLMSQAAERMAQMIDDLLMLASLSRTEPQRVQVDLSTMAEEILAKLRLQEPLRDVHAALMPGLTTQGDAGLLRSALENLLGNAWKYSGRQPIARIAFGVEVKMGESVYYVRDNGAGFDMNHAGKLFNAFQRLHSSDEFPGTGIGLATVQRIVRKLGGRIWAEAEVGKGAAFYFTLA